MASVVTNLSIIMGRRERRERERKRAAASCQSLDGFLAKKKKTTNDDGTSDCVEVPSSLSSTEQASVEHEVDTTLAASSEGSTADPEELPEESTVTTSTATAVSSSDLPLPRTPTLLRTDEEQTVTDIGELYNASKSSSEFCGVVQGLTSAQKYCLLKNHKKPCQNHVFPKTYLGGCNRSFRHTWLADHPWMVYSEQVDGAFCIPCAIFCANPSKGVFVTKPFRAWNKQGEKSKAHERCSYHQHALEKADLLKQAIEQPNTTISAKIDTQKAANIKRNRAILKTIARAVLYCSRQCIALRGDVESIDKLGNPGNFLALLKLLAVYDDDLRSHLEAPAMRCATQVSPQTQNELIKVMGKHMILQGILDDLNSARFFAILADEVTSHNTEHLAICARFVDSNREIREEFLTFVELERITGERIAESILAFLKENDVPVGNMRGQGYDGATNMSSCNVGVQARIRQEAPLATYMHCSGHCLNLVISQSCALPQVRNVLDRLRNCCRYFLNSPKRTGVLEMIVRHNVIDPGKRKPLLDLCKTRWAERHCAYQHFYQAYIFIVEALELIGFHRHVDKYGDTYADWDATSRSDAQQVLGGITSFEFIVVFLTIYQYLSHLAGITVKLQKVACDIVQAHQMIKDVSSTYKEERKNVSQGFSRIYAHSVTIAEKVGATVGMPRIASRQQHRSNAEAVSAEEYFRRNIAIPFLEHVIVSIEQQFSQASMIAISLLGLVPSVLCSKEVDIEAAVIKYNCDLPSPELLQMELQRWKSKYMAVPPEKRPSSPGKAIKDCDSDDFPNIFTLLQIACTIPVTSCECERSASVLRRLNNYMRASMGKNRLSHLALLHIHYDTPIDLDKVVDCYAQLHPRRLALESLLS